ncbi:hypothetical protein NQ315_012832, partial [Exocentrus adspersus]
GNAHARTQSRLHSRCSEKAQHKQLLAGNHTQQTCRPRVPDQQSRRKFAQVRKSAGFATEAAAQTPAKAQVYPGHSKAKEPVADQPLPQADVPPASQRTSTELTSQEVSKTCK